MDATGPPDPEHAQHRVGADVRGCMSGSTVGRAGAAEGCPGIIGTSTIRVACRAIRSPSGFRPAQGDEHAAQRREPARAQLALLDHERVERAFGVRGRPEVAAAARAVVDRVGEVVERGDHVVRGDVRQPERPHAGGVDHPAAELGGQRQGERRDGRVPALADRRYPPDAPVRVRHAAR